MNNQLIGILSHCGVPVGVFKEFLEQDLHDTLGVVNDYLDSPIALRDWISERGSIYSIRCSGADEYHDSLSGEPCRQEPRCITYNQAGIPTMLEEVCVSLLEAGFLPKTNKFLRSKLKNLLTKACDKTSEKM